MNDAPSDGGLRYTHDEYAPFDNKPWLVSTMRFLADLYVSPSKFVEKKIKKINQRYVVSTAFPKFMMDRPKGYTKDLSEFHMEDADVDD